jgi:hemoglobin-like flavoprotein
MTPEQVNLITQSFDKMWPIRRNLAVKFYDRFFETTPDARRLFPNDMERLHLKLMDTVAAIVGALDNPALLQSIISHMLAIMLGLE